MYNNIRFETNQNLLNIKGVSVITGIIAVIAIVMLMPIKPGDVPPPITDNSDVVDDASMEKNSHVKDSPNVADIAATDNDNDELDHYIDENGIKHFILDVKDIPSFEGQLIQTLKRLKSYTK